MRANTAAGIVCLALTAVFGLQIRIDNPQAAIYPIVILAALTTLGLALLIAGLLHRAPTAAEAEPGPRPSWRLFLPALAVLLAWSITVSLIGFAITGTICFIAIASLVRKGKPTPKTAGIDVLVAATTVVACALLFTRLLNVPLPVSAFLGI